MSSYWSVLVTRSKSDHVELSNDQSIDGIVWGSREGSGGNKTKSDRTGGIILKKEKT